MADDELLELRIHGVNNTPPVSLLYAIEEEYGDSLVGVYRQRPNAGLTKAFSWGGLARTSPFPRIRFATWVRSVGSAAWIFVVPFGLANVAYWSRKLTMPGEPYAHVRTTSAIARIFALGLTLLLVSSVCSVSLDMAEGRVLAKAPLPNWLSWLRNHLDAGDRMAIFSLAPLVTMLLLWWLAVVSRNRYDHGSKVPDPAAVSMSATNRAQALSAAWKFGTRAFWDNADLSAHNASIHISAGVALASTWTGQFWFAEHRPAGVVVVATSVAIILGCVGLIARMPLATEQNAISHRRRALSRVILWASFANSSSSSSHSSLALPDERTATSGPPVVRARCIGIHASGHRRVRTRLAVAAEVVLHRGRTADGARCRRPDRAPMQIAEPA